MQLIVEKSPVPIIWLDTSVIINITLWRMGQSIEPRQKERVEFLYNRIHDLTREKKLICPRADQREEIWKGRAECLEILEFLALGIHAFFHENVKDFQTRQFMKAFIQGEDDVTINYSDFFHDDPVEQLNSQSDTIISVDLGLIESGDDIRQRRDSQAKTLEALRERLVKEGVSYNDQLDKEYMADLDALLVLLSRMIKGELSPLESWSFMDIVSNYFHWWDTLGGEQSKIYDFFTSPYYRSIPMNSISSRVSAKIMTGHEPIKSGHMMDIYHASSAIPYVDLFITDRYMKHIISDLGIDDDYHTVVCNVGESEHIEAFLSGL